MRAYTGFCILFALVALTAKASETTTTKIEGGIAASNGKQVFFFSFENGKVESITSHLEGAVIKPPFAVSEDGKKLVWMTEEGKLHTCLLPLGSEHIVKKSTMRNPIPDLMIFDDDTFNPSKDLPLEKQTLQERKIASLELSPNGNYVSFEANMKASHGWTLVPKGSQLDQAWFAKNGRSGFAPDYAELPMYAECGGGYFHGLMISEISINNVLQMRFRCGNSYEQAGTTKWRPSWQPSSPMEGALSESASAIPILGHRIAWSIEDCCKRYSYRRDAGLVAWSKDDRMEAHIYQTGPNTFGPIEIKDVSIDMDKLAVAAEKQQKRSSKIIEGYNSPICEIDIRLDSCNGLAWTPAGNLTIRKGDKIFKISKEEIDQGFANSRLISTKNIDRIYNGRTIVTNNVFQVKPVELPVYDLQGTKLCWVSENVFIIRRDDGGLYAHDLQKNGGRPEKLIPKVPADWFYCKYSPAAPEMIAKASSLKKSDNSWPGVKSGIDRISNKSNSFGDHRIDELFRQIKIAQRDKSDKDKRGYIRLETADLKNIEDPSIFQYQKFYGACDCNAWRKDSVIIIRCGKAFMGAQEINYGKDWSEFQWKYWPEIKGKVLSEIIYPNFQASAARIAKSSFTVNPEEVKRNKTLLLGRFYISDLKLFWEKIDGQLPETLQLTFEPKTVLDCKPLFGFAEQSELSEIKDIAKIGFKAAGSENMKSERIASVTVSVNQIIVFKAKDGFMGIKLVQVEDNHVTYEQKYWPSGQSGDLAKADLK